MVEYCVSQDKRKPSLEGERAPAQISLVPTAPCFLPSSFHFAAANVEFGVFKCESNCSYYNTFYFVERLHLTYIVFSTSQQRDSQQGWMSCSASTQLSICAHTQELCPQEWVGERVCVCVCKANSRENVSRLEWLSTEMYMRFKLHSLFPLLSLPALFSSFLCLLGALVS